MSFQHQHIWASNVLLPYKIWLLHFLVRLYSISGVMPEMSNESLHIPVDEQNWIVRYTFLQSSVFVPITEYPVFKRFFYVFLLLTCNSRFFLIQYPPFIKGIINFMSFKFKVSSSNLYAVTLVVPNVYLQKSGVSAFFRQCSMYLLYSKNLFYSTRI